MIRAYCIRELKKETIFSLSLNSYYFSFCLLGRDIYITEIWRIFISNHDLKTTPSSLKYKGNYLSNMNMRKFSGDAVS